MQETEKYKAYCKATDREDSEPRYSHNWVTSRRAWFRIFQDRIECGKWVIPFNTVQKAIVYKTSEMFIPVKVLHLITDNGSYQFGFNPWARPLDYLDLDVEEQQIKMSYSLFSIVLRVGILSYLFYWLWSKFGN